MYNIKMLFMCVALSLSFTVHAEKQSTVDFDYSQNNLDKCKNPSIEKRLLVLSENRDAIYAVCCCTDVNGNKCCGNAEVCGGPIPGCSCQ